MKQTILVVGASGNVGSEIVKILKQQGHQVVSTTSKKSTDPLVRHLNLATGEGVKEAFLGIDRAFILSPAGYADQYKILSPLIAQAKVQKLKKVVLMSAMGADADPNTPLRKAEVELETSGLNYNIIRPNWFMQNFNTFWVGGILSQSKILLPAGSAKTSFIDARDISAVAAKLLTTDDSFSNKAYNLTGSEAIDHSQVALAISEASGRKVSYQEISSEEFVNMLSGFGLAKDYVQFLNLIMGYLKAGYNSTVTSSVKDILGREPLKFQNYAKDYRASFIAG